MKNAAIAVLLAVCLAVTATVQARDVGMGVLTIWPTARSTALAGAMTGLADEVDAAYCNPAGLAFQTTGSADISYYKWLPGLYPGMQYVSAAGGVPLNLGFLRGRRAFIAGSVASLEVGRMSVFEEHTGRYIKEIRPSRVSVGADVAATLSSSIAIGLGAKLLMSRDAIPPWPYL
jgi:hypothetical protein